MDEYGHGAFPPDCMEECPQCGFEFIALDDETRALIRNAALADCVEWHDPSLL